MLSVATSRKPKGDEFHQPIELNRAPVRLKLKESSANIRGAREEQASYPHITRLGTCEQI
jgi:hypothetical protein